MQGQFYLTSLPKKDDLVIADMTKFENNIIDVTLTEFENIIGQVFIKNMKIKKVRSLVKIGRQEVFKVMEVDHEKRYIDLDIRYVDADERKLALDRYKIFRSLRTAVWKIALQEDLDQTGTQSLYLKLISKIIRDRNLIDLTPDLIIKEMLSFTPDSELESGVQKEFRQRHIPSKYRIEGEMLLNCFDTDGIDAVKTILGEQLEKAIEEYRDEVELDIVMNKAPSYYVLAQSSDKEKGVLAVNMVINRIGEEFTKKGDSKRYRFKVNTEAKVIGDETAGCIQEP